VLAIRQGGKMFAKLRIFTVLWLKFHVGPILLHRIRWNLAQNFKTSVAGFVYSLLVGRLGLGAWSWSWIRI